MKKGKKNKKLPTVTPEPPQIMRPTSEEERERKMAKSKSTKIEERKKS